MILSGKSIQQAWKSGEIGIDPEPDAEQFQPASLDVRLGGALYDTVSETTYRNHLALKPGRPYISYTEDDIRLPDYLAAMMTGRSSIGRSGIIVHKTAGWVDPGFSGQLTLEMFNFGSEEVRLESGDRVAQLVFFRTDFPTEGYDGQYQGQSGITPHDN